MNETAPDELIATIEELERLYEQAKGDLLSPAWAEMQQRLEEVQELTDRLRPH